ncbi:MAG TPA: hypothetical protein VH352_15140 [Pseudonocardiaceae bacterium]|nr:hypothetical protein [Pseudonocardiaceae bacterium]
MDEPFDPFDPNATQQLPHEPPQPTMHIGQAGPLPPPQVWHTPVWRRRGPLIGAGVLILAIVGLVVGIVVAMPASTPTPTNTAASAPATGTPKAGHGHKAKAKGNGQAKLAPGESVLLGTVGSVSGTQLTVTPDSGPQVTLTTASTKIAGGAKAVTDLKPGERVEVVVKNGAAVTVRVPQVHDTGTVINLNGTQATLVEADGQTVALDLSGIGQQLPANGNVVVVTGSVTNGGRTVQVSKVAPAGGTG